MSDEAKMKKPFPAVMRPPPVQEPKPLSERIGGSAADAARLLMEYRQATLNRSIH